MQRNRFGDVDTDRSLQWGDFHELVKPIGQQDDELVVGLRLWQWTREIDCNRLEWPLHQGQTHRLLQKNHM